MKRSSRPHKPAELSKALNRQLSMYALAASAAGVGLLALTHPASARIVYTPAHKAIKLGDKVPLDLNHDGKADFMLQESLFFTSVVQYHYIVLAAFPPPAHMGNEIWGVGDDASALAAGVRIGPDGRFSPGKREMATLYSTSSNSGICAGAWSNVKKHYLGFKFTSKGKTHFGWARLNVSCTNKNGIQKVSGLLTGYAYETIANKAIITGQTRRKEVAVRYTSLGHLAAGASAIPAWRVKQTTATTH